MGENLKDLLEAARQKGVSSLASVITGSAIGEPALRSVDGSVVFDLEGLHTPLRKDVARDESGSWVTADVDANGIRPSSPLETAWRENLAVTILSLKWDYVTFSLAPRVSGVNFDSVREWFLRWFDLDELREATSEGLAGVVHFVSDPECRDGRWELTVDFGSAPTHAFEELLDCFVALGFTVCEVR